MSRRDRWGWVQLGRALTPPHRPNAMVIMWRWRHEIATVALLLLGGLAASEVIGLWPTVGAAIAVAATVALHRGSRRLVSARFWCVVTEHRLRRALVEAWCHTRRGRIPWIVWCAPASYGERVLLWCPAGVTVDDLIGVRGLFADACYAVDVVVARHDRWRHLAVVAVVRRGPAAVLEV